MKRKLLWLAAAALVLLCVVFFRKIFRSPSTSMVGYQRLTPGEFKERLDGDSGAILLDVRHQDEYDGGHILGALLLPNEEIGKTAPALLPDKEAELLVYCRSGRRSKDAVCKLLTLGYTRVYDCGGLNDWPYETVR